MNADDNITHRTYLEDRLHALECGLRDVQVAR